MAAAEASAARVRHVLAGHLAGKPAAAPPVAAVSTERIGVESGPSPVPARGRPESRNRRLCVTIVYLW
jgi:hypothetical protein